MLANARVTQQACFSIADQTMRTDSTEVAALDLKLVAVIYAVGDELFAVVVLFSLSRDRRGGSSGATRVVYKKKKRNPG